jgi:hypothetical protein
MHFPDNIGGLVTAVDALRPVESAAAASFALKGVAVDLEKHQSALLMVSTGAVTGSPASQTVDAKLQHSDTTTDGDFSDVAAHANNPAVAITQITAADSRRYLEVMRTQTLKRYVRLVFTVAFSGGSSPKIGLQATAIVSGSPIKPVVHA